MANNLDLQVAIEEMRIHLQRQNESVQAYKATARSLLSAASLIVALTATLQLFSVKIEPSSINLYNLLIVSAMALYIALIFCCVATLFPIDLKGPIGPDWELLRKVFFNKEDREILKIQLSQLVRVISRNATTLESPSRYVRFASVLLPVVVILLFGLSLVPRV